MSIRIAELNCVGKPSFHATFTGRRITDGDLRHGGLADHFHIIEVPVGSRSAHGCVETNVERVAQVGYVEPVTMVLVVVLTIGEYGEGRSVGSVATDLDERMVSDRE